MKILFLTNIPSPYRVDFFNELGKFCALTVVFERRSSAERDQSWMTSRAENYEEIYLNGFHTRVDASLSVSVIRHLKRTYDFIFVANYATPTGIVAVTYLNLMGIPFVLEADGGFRGNGKGGKEWLKRWLISKAEWYFSTSKELDAYYLFYGANPHALIRYPFSSVRKQYILAEALSQQQKSAIRERLGLPEGFLILAVGQFIHRKGFDTLIEAFTKVTLPCTLCIVGGKPDEQYIQLAKKAGQNKILFQAFIPPMQLTQYYQAADVFAMPTREDIWGLVINEAMANGLPIITTNRCIAGLEMVEEGKCGHILEPEDADSLARCITQLAKSPSHCNDMAHRSLEVAREYTIEAMVQAHVAFIEGGDGHANK